MGHYGGGIDEDLSLVVGGALNGPINGSHAEIPYLNGTLIVGGMDGMDRMMGWGIGESMLPLNVGRMDDVIDGGDGAMMGIDGLISCLDGMDGSDDTFDGLDTLDDGPVVRHTCLGGLDVIIDDAPLMMDGVDASMVPLLGQDDGWIHDFPLERATGPDLTVDSLIGVAGTLLDGSDAFFDGQIGQDATMCGVIFVGSPFDGEYRPSPDRRSFAHSVHEVGESSHAAEVVAASDSDATISDIVVTGDRSGAVESAEVPAFPSSSPVDLPILDESSLTSGPFVLEGVPVRTCQLLPRPSC